MLQTEPACGEKLLVQFRLSQIHHETCTFLHQLISSIEPGLTKDPTVFMWTHKLESMPKAKKL